MAITLKNFGSSIEYDNGTNKVYISKPFMVTTMPANNNIVLACQHGKYTFDQLDVTLPVSTSLDELAFLIQQMMINTGQHVSILLDDVGNQTGATDATGDYSVTPKTFKISPTVGQAFVISNLIIAIEDSTGMDAVKYGNITALTNGVNIEYDTNGTTLVLTPQIIKTNGNYVGSFGAEKARHTSFGSGNEYFTADLAFNAFDRQGLILNGATSDELRVELNDDFGGLISHYFTVQGLKFGV